MADLAKRVVIFATFVLFLAGIVMISVALGTQHWLYSEPQRNGSSETVGPKSLVYAGLFGGLRSLDSGLGPRVRAFSVPGELASCSELLSTCASFYTRGLWVGTILFASIALLWALFGVVFALTNTVIRPVQTVAGPLGLYLWAALAAIGTGLSALFFLVQFASDLRRSVLLPTWHPDASPGFSSEGKTSLDWSFYLLIGALGSFLSVVGVLLVSGLDLRSVLRQRTEKEAPHLHDRGVLMY